jgi:tRNA (adenine22-N1)-methyltransferase
MEVGLKKIKLSERLCAVAGFVDIGSAIVDVGTDHGFIPVYLKQKNIASKIIASDINKGPLDSAIRTAEAYGVTGIDFRLCDGLKGVKQEEADSVIIAGMGGESIIDIIKASDWCFEGKSLILQPMTKQAELISWLYDNGFTVTGESFAAEGKEIYRVLKVACKRSEAPRKAFIYGGFTYTAYTERLYKRLQKALKGIEKAAEPDDRIEEYKTILEDIKAAYVHDKGTV